MEKNKFIISVLLIVSAVILIAIHTLKSTQIEIERAKSDTERYKFEAEKAKAEAERAKVEYKAKEIEGLTVSTVKNTYIMCLQSISSNPNVKPYDINDLCSEAKLHKGNVKITK